MRKIIIALFLGSLCLSGSASALSCDALRQQYANLKAQESVMLQSIQAQRAVDYWCSKADSTMAASRQYLGDANYMASILRSIMRGLLPSAVLEAAIANAYDDHGVSVSQYVKANIPTNLQATVEADCSRIREDVHNSNLALQLSATFEPWCQSDLASSYAALRALQANISQLAANLAWCNQSAPSQNQY
jgi:hypothetical protein